MSPFWLRPLATIGIFLIPTLFLWVVTDSTVALLTFSALLLAYLYHHLKHVKSLDEWLSQPQADKVPEGTGIWEDIFAVLYRMIKRQSRSKYQLSAVLERFQKAGDAMPDGVIMLNDQDMIEWFNPVAQQQFGLNPATDRGRPINYLIRQSQFTDYLAAHNYAEPLIMKSTRNQDVTLSIQLVPFGDKQKLLISSDITELERVDTVRRDFVANVSHELRTPLTVVGGFLETLTDHENLGMDETRHYLKLMLDQTHRMQRLVDDLLTLSRLESASSPLQEEKINMERLLELLLQEATSLSSGRHKIQMNFEPGLDLLGSENEIRSAFGNLISNAIRYTPDGGEISLSWGMSGNESCFSVKDTGIGIDSLHLPRLTERFYRVDRSRSRETGGTGLGLSIVKHVLTRHQARLAVTSEMGKGSTFSVCFPLTRIVHSEVQQKTAQPH
jgi:two-component system phosphate regulon sensor histidine kinase PhoR